MQNSTESSLDWDDVRYFLEVARQGKLTAAARLLGVEHSTVARRVGMLEARIGLRLFDRLPKCWNLTPEGEALLEHARRIEEQALAFARASTGFGALAGTVRVSAPPVFASHFLVPRLARLRQRWPGITIELIGEAREANLYRREADLALRLQRPTEPGLAARALGELGYGLYGTPEWLQRPPGEWQFVGYGEAAGDATPAGAAGGARPGNAQLAGTPQQRWLEQLAAGRPFSLRTNDLAAMHQACRGGLGVAALPHFLARDDSALLAFPQECPVSRPVWLVIHPDVRRSPRVALVATLLGELVREHAAALA